MGPYRNLSKKKKKKLAGFFYAHITKQKKIIQVKTAIKGK